ncbi:MAG: hypothetical protein WCA48_06890, partial [Pseudomonas gingeri]
MKNSNVFNLVFVAVGLLTVIPGAVIAEDGDGGVQPIIDNTPPPPQPAKTLATVYVPPPPPPMQINVVYGNLQVANA